MSDPEVYDVVTNTDEPMEEAESRLVEDKTDKLEASNPTKEEDEMT